VEELHLEHTSGQWRLFIDPTEGHFEGNVLHNGNKFPSIPWPHALHMKETYKNL